MERKKSKRANLEGKRLLFLEIGFIFSLGLALLAFEWTSKSEDSQGFQNHRKSNPVQESIPITHQERQKPIEPPPPPQAIEVLNIIDNEVQIKDELRLEETGADMDTRILLDAFGQEESEESEEQKIFFVAEEMPIFKGNGIAAFRDYIQKHIEYPVIASENGIEGTVFLSFVVDTCGGVSGVTIMKGVDPSINKEAKRVVKSAPQWEPGKQKGRPVKVQFIVPVVFTLH